MGKLHEIGFAGHADDQRVWIPEGTQNNPPPIWIFCKNVSNDAFGLKLIRGMLFATGLRNFPFVKQAEFGQLLIRKQNNRKGYTTLIANLTTGVNLQRRVDGKWQKSSAILFYSCDTPEDIEKMKPYVIPDMSDLEAPVTNSTA